MRGWIQSACHGESVNGDSRRAKGNMEGLPRGVGKRGMAHINLHGGIARRGIFPIARKGAKEKMQASMKKQYQALIYGDSTMTRNGYATLDAFNFEIDGGETGAECDAYAVFHVAHDIMGCYPCETYDLWRDLTPDDVQSELDIANEIKEGDIYAAYVYDVTESRFMYTAPKGFAFPIPGDAGITVRAGIAELYGLDFVYYDVKQIARDGASINYTFFYDKDTESLEYPPRD